LASTLYYRGLVLGMQGKDKEALENLKEAVQLRVELVENHGRSELRNELALSLIGRGNAQEKLGMMAEARADYAKALATATNEKIRRLASEWVERAGS
jgi:tetratricopeptide (TPR) repeat protein